MMPETAGRQNGSVGKLHGTTRPGFGLTTHTTHITRHFRRPLPATLETKSPWIRTYHAYHAYHAPFPSATSRHVGDKIALDSDLPRIPRISRAISVGHFPPRWRRNRPGFGLTTHTTHITHHFRRPLPATLESKSPWIRTYHAYHAYHAPFPSATSRHVGVEIALDSDLPRIPRISRAISVATSRHTGGRNTRKILSPFVKQGHSVAADWRHRPDAQG